MPVGCDYCFEEKAKVTLSPERPSVVTTAILDQALFSACRERAPEAWRRRLSARSAPARAR
jgi:hypothetical protein